VTRSSARWAIAAAAAAVVAIGIGAYFAYGTTDRSGSAAEQLKSWVQGTNLGQSIGTVVGDAARVRAALAAHRGSGVVHTDCGVLLTDAQQANGELPTPDTQLTDLLSSGYALAYDAGYDCYNSAGTNAALVAKASRERIEAEAKLQQAVNLVGQILGSPLSTTTTTQPGSAFLG
jgi:hypothetical protein